MARILVIEDQPALCRLYQIVLEQQGHESVLAETGKAGIEAAKRTKPDLVILDLVLPDMPGVQVVERLRQDGILSNAPLIVTTGIGQEDAETIAESHGACAVLIKPFDIGEISASVRVALDAAAQHTPPG